LSRFGHVITMMMMMMMMMMIRVYSLQPFAKLCRIAPTFFLLKLASSDSKRKGDNHQDQLDG
jgi:hypothetical protein